MASQKQQEQFSKKSVGLGGVFSRIFRNFFGVGILLIIFALYLQEIYLSTDRPTDRPFVIFVKLLENVGIAIVISTIFTYVMGTAQFINFITNQLEKIIVSKDFLANISPDHKKKAIQMLIQPTESEVRKYPNIGNYYGSLSTKMLSISEHGIRSNYFITCKAFFDEKEQKIAVDAIYNYRLYPSSNGFEDIKVGFLTGEKEKSTCKYIHIANNQGERYPEKDHDPKLLLGFKKEEISEEDNVFSIKTESLDISQEQEHLDVELHATEYGDSKLMLYTFIALQDTHGFKLRLECDHNVMIKEFCTFVIDAEKFEDFDKKNPKIIQISCNQWIGKGSGLAILLAIEEYEENSDSAPNM